ncbi:MAG: aspartate kinase, partial [Gammaproteobacteria bacterium]
MASEWLVMKLGGTSVARRAHWENIVVRIGEALAERRRVLVVHSALAGTTDRLVELIAADANARRHIVDQLTVRHYTLARELGVAEGAGLDLRLDELRAMVSALPLSRIIVPAERARLLAMGERLLSELALPFLRARGLPVRGVDARELLTVRTRPGAHPSARFLAATCEAMPDAAFASRLRSLPPLVLTQGFFARDEEGRTVLLGRGGSDVSAACLAAKLSSAELEIWTDVPGLFSADPNRLASARLLRELDYDEALEIAANGGRVLHPRCIPPLRRAAIPLTIRYTPRPGVAGTSIRADSPAGAEGLKAVCMRRHIAVITLDTLEMWRRAGFLADVFACFKHRDLSVDMVATSETRVTVSLDWAVNPDIERRLEALRNDLCGLARVEVKTDCAAVSLVGKRIRSNLGEIAPLLEIFEGRRVHLLSQASNDLNITFVVDDGEASNLVEALHAAFIKQAAGRIFGPSWKALIEPEASRKTAPPWWQTRRDELLELAHARSPRYVYDAATIGTRAETLRGAAIADRLFYAVKANDQADVLRVLYELGLGFECVSLGELEHVL